MYFLLCTPLFRWQFHRVQMKSFPVDRVVSKLCDWTHCGAPCVYSFSIFTPFLPPPLYTSTHFPHPPFSQYGPAQTVGSNPYGTMVTANVMCDILRERERITAKRKDTFSPVVGVEKVISVVMYSCFGNIRFLAERQAKRNYKKRRRRLWRWWKDNETSRFGWSDLPWHSWQILDCSGTPSPRARKRTGH